MEWGTFLKTPLGSRVASPVPLSIGTKVVTGSASRVSSGPTSASASAADQSTSAVLHTLGFHTPGELGASQLSPFRGAGATTLPATWYVAPTATTLTYFQGLGARELAWTMDSPTPSTTASPTDSFVFGIIPGAYFGIELSLSFPTDCAVGALSDALGRSALIRDASSPTSGIFAPDKAAVVESTLIANGVSLQVRVTANKRIAAVESLLSSSACSTGKIADCATLLSALNSVENTFLASLGISDIAKLQSDTDPGWSPVVVMTAELSSVTP